MANRYEISDAGWDLVADLFTQTRRTGRPRIDDRLMLNGVLWVLCSGAAWRDLPERFGPWSTVYQRFRDWRNLGTFDQIRFTCSATPTAFLCASCFLAAKRATLRTPNHSLMTFAYPLRGAVLVNVAGGCSPIKATMLKLCAATAIAIGCSRSYRCAP